MKRIRAFSFGRWWAMVLKEFLQLKRDRVSFAMIVGVPLMQLILFGFAINTDPKHLPTAILNADPSEFTRSLVSAMEQSDYFEIAGSVADEVSAREALARGDVLFVVNIPPDFTSRLLRGERPSLLVEADATDPTATGMALGAMGPIVRSVLNKNAVGALSDLAGVPDAFDVRLHRLYNPEGITQYNVVPGLMGVILTLMMVLMTGLAITRERERGTMENLLAMPVQSIEVMTGKIVPYIAIGLLQATLILVAALALFRVPFEGNLLTLYGVSLLFVGANLTVGITLSSLAKNQLQAMQMTVFYFLPNLLLSGFMFPFFGMPKWAQFIGNFLPLTYYNRLVRNIFLKGGEWGDLWPNIWPMMVFTVVVMTIATLFYRKTLD